LSGYYKYSIAIALGIRGAINVSFYHPKINNLLFYYEYILLQQLFSTDVNIVGVMRQI